MFFARVGKHLGIYKYRILFQLTCSFKGPYWWPSDLQNQCHEARNVEKYTLYGSNRTLESQYKDEQHWKSKARKYFGDKKLSSTTATDVKKERFMNPNYLVISPPPIPQKSRNFSDLFRVPQLPLYLGNAEVLSHQSSQPSTSFFMHY